jgi:CheY-like chemotaxis protein
MRMLIADDNSEVRAALHLLLNEMGWPDIVQAADAKAAMAVVERGQVDVVLLDWELPDGRRARGQGQALAAEIKQTAPGCRVIAMSGRPEAREEALAAGCDGFVSRNEPPDLLLALLGEAES